MKGLLKLSVIAFFVALGVVVGKRMSAEAMAVVIGVVCGVVASIPMSVVILMLTHRLGGREERVERRSDYPPVVVINPPAWEGRSSLLPPRLDQPLEPVSQREFKIVGDDEFTQHS